MVFAEVFRFLCKTVNLLKFIFFAASVFYKGSFNLFSLSPVGDPCSFLFFLFFQSLPFCVWPFLAFSTSVSVFSPPPLSFLCLPLPLFPPLMEVCVLIMMLLGVGTVERLSPLCTERLDLPPPSLLLASSLSFLLGPSFPFMSGKTSGMQREWVQCYVCMYMYVYWAQIPSWELLRYTEEHLSCICTASRNLMNLFCSNTTIKYHHFDWH